MHHSTEWFHWDKKEILENIIYRNSDIIFQGHEHLLHNVVITDEEKMKYVYLKAENCQLIIQWQANMVLLYLTLKITR